MENEVEVTTETKFSKNCEFIAWIVLILGTIGSFWLASKYGFKIEETYSWKDGFEYAERRDWILSIAIFLAGFLTSFTTFTFFGSLAEHLKFMSFLVLEKKKENDV